MNTYCRNNEILRIAKVLGYLSISVFGPCICESAQSIIKFNRVHKEAPMKFKEVREGEGVWNGGGDNHLINIFYYKSCHEFLGGFPINTL